MKARIGFLLATLVLAAAVGHAAEGLPWWSNPWTESFRSASTASLLEDDLDLMLDPGMMPLIEGYRLYTNLANFVDKDEEIFNPADTNNYYLIGGKAPFFGYGHMGLLYDRRFSRSSDTTSATGSYFEDLDANGTYDRRTVQEGMNYSGQQEKDTHWWLGFGREMGTGRIGLLVYHQDGYYKEQPGANNYEGKTTVTDLVTGATTLSAEQSETRNDQTTYSVNGGALSYWRPMTENLDLGVAAGLNIHLAEELDSLTYAYSATSPSTPGVNGTTIDSTAVLNKIPWDHVGLELNLRLAGIYKWNDNVRTRTDLMFSTLSGSTDEGSITSEYNYLSAFQLPAPLGVNSTSITRDRMAETVAQENSFLGVGLFSKTTVKFNDRVEMSIGLGLGSSKGDASTEYTSDYTETIVYNDGDPSLYTDYTQVTTGSEYVKEMYTWSALNILAPVAVEFHITDPVVFRLGAQHSFQYRDFAYTEHHEFVPDRVSYTDAYGVTTVSHLDYFSLNALGYTAQDAYNETRFTYGAGWQITDNLQLDFMGFAKLDDLTNWKLSAIFKF
ncbi:MAG TPA: hypothetical protein DDW31_05420 [candidate division Zixibacteria bacterium]|nr:hypothetical protein [candidate division Zixibacteria bacterium]